MSPICGGLNDPPCMEPSTAGPTWQCDPKLVTFVPGTPSFAKFVYWVYVSSVNECTSQWCQHYTMFDEQQRAVFLCMEDTMSDRQVPADCGAEDQAPCVDGCGNGLTSVIVSETNGVMHNGYDCILRVGIALHGHHTDIL